MWIDVNEIIDWRLDESNKRTPITKSVHIDTKHIIMMRSQEFGTEIYIKNTWLYVTDQLNYILGFIPE